MRGRSGLGASGFPAEEPTPNSIEEGPLMSTVTMKQMLEAGVHFGHQTKRWNPKMKPYIFGARNGIYIVDLQKTVRLAREAFKFVSDVCSRGGAVLFVGTKKKAQDEIGRAACRGRG